MANAIIFFIVAFTVLGIGIKFKVNYGILGLVAAVALSAFFLGSDLNSIIAAFPTSIMFQLVMSMLFFSFASANGTMGKIASHIMYLFRNSRALMPLALWLIGLIVSLSGSGVLAVPVVAPIVFSVILQMGYNPLMAPLTIFTSMYAANFVPWGAAANLFGPWIGSFIGPEAQVQFVSHCNLWMFLFNIILYLVGFVVLKGWKYSNSNVSFDKPEAMTREQKINTGVILGVVLLCVVPTFINSFLPNPVTAWMTKYLSVQVTYLIGMAVLAITGVGSLDERLVKGVPWNMIIGICGFATLMSLCKPMGGVEAIGSVLSVAPAGILTVALSIVSSILGYFVDGTSVGGFVMPLLPAIASAAGVTVAACASILSIGMFAASMSPFSTCGALMLTGCMDEEVRKTLVNKQLVMAVCTCVLFAVLVALGLVTSIGV